MSATLDILIPTFTRPVALAITLSSLVSQTYQDFRVLVSDQNENVDMAELGEIKAVIRILEEHGNSVEIRKHLPRLGMAEQRQYLLNQAQGQYALFMDDDLIMEPWALETLMTGIRMGNCGVAGCGVIGLSYINDRRPHEEAIEFWDGPVQPEIIRPYSKEWERHRLHNAANLYHVQQRLGITPEQPRLYRIAWVGGCVLYDIEKLRSVGGFNFWENLPPTHSGEDVLAQWRVMARFGGAGVLPSGVYHMELPTTIPDRQSDAPYLIGLDSSVNHMG